MKNQPFYIMQLDFDRFCRTDWVICLLHDYCWILVLAISHQPPPPPLYDQIQKLGLKWRLNRKWYIHSCHATFSWFASHPSNSFKKTNHSLNHHRNLPLSFHSHFTWTFINYSFKSPTTYNLYLLTTLFKILPSHSRTPPFLPLLQ